MKKQSIGLTMCLIFFSVIIWRLALLGVGRLADSVLLYEPSFPYAENILATFDLPRFVYSWANFDGVHYLTIVREGYAKINLLPAFFPVYPGILKFGVLFVNFKYSITFGIWVSFVCLFLGSLMWWQAAPNFLNTRPVDPARFRWVSLAILLLFPTALFFAGLYTESLFLLLSVTSLYLGVKRHFLFASLLAGIASGTKIIGIFLVPALLVELWWPYWQHRLQLKSHRVSVTLATLAIVCIGSLGLALYSGYLQHTFHDPLYFLHVQSEFGAGRQESLVWYPQTAWRSLKILVTARPFDLKYFAYVQEFVVGLLGCIALIVSIKVVRPSVWLFSVLAFLLPTLTGSFSSMPRYVLACYALFLGLAYVLRQRTIPLILFLLLSTLLLLCNTILFIQGYWVA